MVTAQEAPQIAKRHGMKDNYTPQERTATLKQKASSRRVGSYNLTRGKATFEERLSGKLLRLEGLVIDAWHPTKSPLGLLSRCACPEDSHFALSLMDALRDVLTFLTDCERYNIVPWE